MLNNKKMNTIPFDMSRKPCRQNRLLLLLIWIVCKIMTFGRLKIERTGMKGLRPPYLVLSFHQGFQDYYITPLGMFPHRANYVSDVEGFAAYGKGLYRQVGCLATRRFAGDVRLVENIRHAVKNNGDIVVVYPETRHSIVGTNSKLPQSIGKLVKVLKVPVVIQKLYGSYLAQPVWDEEHSRKVSMHCLVEKVLDVSEIQKLSAVEITERLNAQFVYDEYAWQWEQKIQITEPRRAQGLHKALYLCPRCGEEAMGSSGEKLFCGQCGKEWIMDEYGRLHGSEGVTEFEHIPDWYEHQRNVVRKLLEDGAYRFDAQVVIEGLYNEKGFVPLGEGRLLHKEDGFTLWLEVSGEVLRFPAGGQHSVHIEYDYRGKGDCIVLSTKGCCYYLYSVGDHCRVTKVLLAGEVMYEFS